MSSLTHDLLVENLEAAYVLAQRILRHARGDAVFKHPDRLNQRDQVAHAAAIVALLGQAIECLEDDAP
jgi:hypothetical protein